MTTRREYRCNLCHDELVQMTGSYQGAGIYFTTGGPVRFKATHPRDAENHLCGKCIAAIKDTTFSCI